MIKERFDLLFAKYFLQCAYNSDNPPPIFHIDVRCVLCEWHLRLVTSISTAILVARGIHVISHMENTKANTVIEC